MCVSFCCELYEGKNRIKAVSSDIFLGYVGTVIHKTSKTFKDKMEKC